MDCDTDHRPVVVSAGRPPRQRLPAGRPLVVCVALAAMACGSVGPKTDAGGAGGTTGGDVGGTTGSGGTGAGAGGTAGGGGPRTDAGADLAQGTGGAPVADGGGTGGAAGTGVTDAGVDQPRADAGDAPAPLPVSCQQIKQQNPAAVSGVFTIAPLTTAQSVFCEMTVDGGGWTAFFVGDNGTPPGGAHFETAADSCADPANRCIRRLPVTIDASHDFAVKCGPSVVKFKVGALSLDYLRNGLQHGWQPLTGATTIDVGFVGKANLVGSMWTGSPANDGWIVAGDINTTTTTFANGYTTNASWNYCNGSTQTDNTSRVMLFYR